MATLFEETFQVIAMDPDAKKYTRGNVPNTPHETKRLTVSRFVCVNPKRKTELLLDVNTDVFNVEVPCDRNYPRHDSGCVTDWRQFARVAGIRLVVSNA